MKNFTRIRVRTTDSSPKTSLFLRFFSIRFRPWASSKGTPGRCRDYVLNRWCASLYVRPRGPRTMFGNPLRNGPPKNLEGRVCDLLEHLFESKAPFRKPRTLRA